MVHPARRVSPSGPGPCRADISLLKAPSSASRVSSRALISGFCSSTLLPEVCFPATRCPRTRTTSTSLLEGIPGLFCGLFLSLVHTHTDTDTHTHTQGKIRSDKACRWKLGNGAIIVSHVILIQLLCMDFRVQLLKVLCHFQQRMGQPWERMRVMTWQQRYLQRWKSKWGKTSGKLVRNAKSSKEKFSFLETWYSWFSSVLILNKFTLVFIWQNTMTTSLPFLPRQTFKEHRRYVGKPIITKIINKKIEMLKSKHIKQYLLLNAETLFRFYPMFLAETLEKIKILTSLLISKASTSSGLMTCAAECCLGERDETITCSRLSVWCWTTPWSWTFPRSAADGLFCILFV